MQSARYSLAVAMVAILLTFGCNKGKPDKAAGPPGAQAPAAVAAEVDVVNPTQQQIVDYREYTGRTAAADKVEVRSRVSGYILQTPRSKNQSGNASSDNASQAGRAEPDSKSRVTVGEGDLVKKDALLFEIDAEPYQLAFDQAAATQAAARATLRRYDLDLARAKELVSSKSVSQADLDLAIANQAEATAQMNNLESTRKRAELDLRYTRILSPFDGIVGQTLVTRGNLVIADTTVLTTVVSTDPVYVYFDVDEHSLLDYRQRIRSGAVKSARDTQIAIKLALANESEFIHSGYIDFVDNTTDPSTGNTRLRGTFPNPDNSLSPGLFARVKVPFTAEYNALFVPTRALAMDQQGRFLMVVDDKQLAQRRAIEVGTERDGKTVVAKGLKPEDVVIVEGLQKVRPKTPVKTRPMKTAETLPDTTNAAPANAVKE